MPHFTTQLTSALAAVLIATVSFSAIVTVPPAQAQIITVELA